MTFTITETSTNKFHLLSCYDVHSQIPRDEGNERWYIQIAMDKQ